MAKKRKRVTCDSCHGKGVHYTQDRRAVRSICRKCYGSGMMILKDK